MFSTSPWRGRKGTVAALSSWLSLLFLSCPLTVTAKSASDYYVPSLPGAPDGPLLKMHAGHIEVDQEHNGHLFFWHFQNRHIANRQRTVIWLNGGPGCSSLDGALMEVGPYRLKDDHTLEYNNGSWDEFANLLFVDQPVGTGFSYVNTNSFLHELDEMGAQFITFLTNWFQLFPEYENDDIYIAGESYAGQHIPYITKHILERNKDAAASGKAKWNVRGLLIGNGWVSPADQYPSYLEFAYKEGIVQTGSQKANNLEALQSACISTLTAPGGTEHVDNGKCEEVLQELLRLTADNGGQCYNMYDVRLRDEYPSCGMNWPPDLVNVKPYLRQPEVVKALNINPDKKTGWEECSGAVSSSFRAKHSLPAIDLLPDILESGVPILLFSGDKDLICNHLGTEQLIHNMKWGGGSGFELSPGIWAPRRDWTFEGEPAGLYQQARNLTYVLFYNASHMVPFDFPRRTRDMLDRFMKVDIASIGGTPADSRIDGEKLPQTSVGGQPNSTTAEEKEKERLKEATWKAYAKSGETALVIVIIGVSVWGYFIWRSRRNRRGYREVRQRGRRSTASALERFRSRSNGTDIEAGDFDETTLDQLSTPRTDQDRFSVGAEDSEDEAAARRNGATGTSAPHKAS